MAGTRISLAILLYLLIKSSQIFKVRMISNLTSCIRKALEFPQSPAKEKDWFSFFIVNKARECTSSPFFLYFFFKRKVAFYLRSI